MNENTEIQKLTAGMPMLYAGNRLTYVSETIAERFKAGDRLVVVNDTGDILHIPEREHALTTAAVNVAMEGFQGMAAVTDDQVSAFFEAFAVLLESVAVWAAIESANANDVALARERGRSTTRLVTTPKMRADMIAGLRDWRDAASARGRVLERVEHTGWSVELVSAPLGIVGFVFEGRPNVFADATGVLRGGNTVVFRIGSDALRTAKAIMTMGVEPALLQAGLPPGAVVMVESAEHAAGWSLFADSRLSLAVARGSGKAVALYGSVARQSGIPVSLHGTGGAWLVVDRSADPVRLRAAVRHSLDRKVCNTLNVCVLQAGCPELTATVWEALQEAGEPNNRGVKVHVVEGNEPVAPQEWFSRHVDVRRADGIVRETMAEAMAVDQLAREWEWEETPEVSLTLAASLDEAATLFNRYSPQFIACLVAEDPDAHRRFYERVNAPFFGNGFTRWADGQFALNRPELGLSNWQSGRLFGRGAILSGDGIYTVRTRVEQSDPDVHR